MVETHLSSQSEDDSCSFFQLLSVKIHPYMCPALYLFTYVYNNWPAAFIDLLPPCAATLAVSAISTPPGFGHVTSRQG